LTGYSNYPFQIDTSAQLPISTDNVTPVKAEVVNRLRDAILSIENELGVDPSREFGTVRARLDALAAGGSGGGAVEILQNGAEVLSSANALDFTGNVQVTVTQPFRASINVVGGQTVQIQESFSSAGGQTVFILSHPPIQPVAVMMFLDGVKQLFGTDYNVAGSTVTYTGTVPLINTDRIEFWYMVDVSTVPQVGPPGPVGASNPVRVPLVAGRQQFFGTTLITVGGSSVDMNDYPATYATLSRSIFFVIDYSVAANTDTASVRLWDATHGVIVAGTTDSSSSVTPPRRFLSSALTVGATSGNIRNDVVTEYQVQAAVSSGSSVNNAICYDAYLLVKYS
jgi:hypothetical protein